MKKYILAFCLLGFCVATSFGQEVFDIVSNSNANQRAPRHEITLNTLYLIAGFPEITYEYLIDEDSSVGLSYAVNNDTNMDTKYAFTPHYRFYMGKKRAAGFFMEGNSFIHYTRGREDDIFNSITGFYEDVYNDYKMYVGLGIAVGGKFIVKDTWVTELYAGLGRILNDSQEELDVPIYPRIGISIGKRF